MPAAVLREWDGVVGGENCALWNCSTAGSDGFAVDDAGRLAASRRDASSTTSDCRLCSRVRGPGSTGWAEAPWRFGTGQSSRNTGPRPCVFGLGDRVDLLEAPCDAVFTV